MTFKSVSTSGTVSSKASGLFDLNEHGDKSILVYKYRSGAKGLDVTTERDLCAELDNNSELPFIRVTRKPIPRGASRLDISNEDLLLPEERDKFAEKLAPKISVANVGLPTAAKWRRMILGSFEDLYIVHRGHSLTPESSKNNSPESSQQVSPASTFPSDNAHPFRNPDA
ncbi:hypothetical protein P153DRAFT_380823 [Dothidotthia symphoricarpi CBS 119687]|uniref:Uncharacterized protein n=1 Tax=Dothidotthia symphoricarpi CBS 119687 TaxID=1392245 RepID=A0A6A6AUY8_9PLEO|nr:uncharacterized protein P153DRAFT_380823 [Dothidotthia symphoricarpi CBS 119687]KAF2135023.1 hypothetical protein P153DRAFT_380823 [Dothidotthia symphoricarpi CBS 119687]